MPSYLIEVDTTQMLTRTYTVTADSPEEALELYQADDVRVDFYHDNEDLGTATEHGDTAVVLTDDDTKTILLQASDALSEE
jgi:hypothetical protein